MALGVINGNEGVVDVALAVDVVKKHVQDLHDLIGDHGNVIENHDEVEMMSDDDDGGDNNYLDNVEDLDDQGSDEMPRSGHRRGYHSKRGPCTIDDEDDEDDQDAHECGTPKKTLRVDKEDP